MRAWSRVLGFMLALQVAAGCGDSASEGKGGDDDSGGGSTGGSTSTGGSGATGGSTSGGGTGGSTMGGTGATGGSTGGSMSTGGSGGGGQIPESPLCEPFAEHVAAECPDAWTYEDGIYTCEDGFRIHYPTGCGTEWGNFVTCMTEGEIDCETGSPIDCTPEESGYFACESAFVGRVGCVQSGPSEMCPAGQFSFGCLGGPIPNGCTEIETGAAVPYACCPPFPD